MSLPASDPVLLSRIPAVSADFRKLALTFISLSVQGLLVLLWLFCFVGDDSSSFQGWGPPRPATAIWMGFRLAGLMLFLMVSLWWNSLVALYVVRLSALELARNRKGTLPQAGWYAWSYARSVWLPVGIVVGTVGLILLGCSGLRGAERIPYVGEVGSVLLLLVVWILAMAIILLLAGLLGAYPLMIAAVAVEGRGSFDALVRGYGYFYHNPMRALGYWFRSLLTALPAILLVEGLGIAVWWLTYLLWTGTWQGIPAPEWYYHRLFSPPGDLPSLIQAALNLSYAGLLLSYPFLVLLVASPAIYLTLRQEIEGVATNVIRREPSDENNALGYAELGYLFYPPFPDPSAPATGASRGT